MRQARIGVGLAMLVTSAVIGPSAAPAAKVTPRIEYRITGGFVGIDNRLVIDAHGRAVLKTYSQALPTHGTYRRTLKRAEHDRLLRLVRAVRIERLPRRYTPATPVADGISNTLTFRGFKVTVEQGSNPPTRLERALDALNRLANIIPR